MGRAIIAENVMNYDYSLKNDLSAVVKIDLEKAFKWSTLAENIRAAVGFALKTAMRNASAGKMDTEEAAATAATARCRSSAMQTGWRSATRAFH